MMKAAQYKEFSQNINDVKLTTVPKPVSRPGYAVVKVKVAAGNPIDHEVMKGYLKDFWPMNFPFTMGYEFSGVVDSIDVSDSSKLAVGDEVFAANWGLHQHNDDDMVIAGAFAEFILMPVKKLSKKPSSVTFEQAAALSAVGITAQQSLFDLGKVVENTKILIIGGPTSVGAIAIQLAKKKGAYVAATASTRNVEYTKECGADFVVNYKDKKWEECPELKGFDVVFDIVGEKDALSRARDKGVLKENGRFISLNNPEVGFDPSVYPPLEYAAMYSVKHDTQGQDELAALVGKCQLTVKIDEEFPFTEEGVHAMLKKLEAGTSIGKNILKIC